MPLFGLVLRESDSCVWLIPMNHKIIFIFPIWIPHRINLKYWFFFFFWSLGHKIIFFYKKHWVTKSWSWNNLEREWWLVRASKIRLKKDNMVLHKQNKKEKTLCSVHVYHSQQKQKPLLLSLCFETLKQNWKGMKEWKEFGCCGFTNWDKKNKIGRRTYVNKFKKKLIMEKLNFPQLWLKT